MVDRDCETAEALEADVALGVADPQDLATVLAHLEHCATCRARFRALAEVMDALVELVPSAEPPSGFESRVLSSLREERPARPTRMRDRRLLQAAAGIALVLLVGVGGWLLGGAATGPAPTTGAAKVVSADLIGREGVVGQALIETGAEPWMSMAVQGALGHGAVRCQVRTASGHMVTVGTFTVSDGYGYWAAPLPPGSSVRSARLVNAKGRVLATAVFSAPR